MDIVPGRERVSRFFFFSPPESPPGSPGRKQVWTQMDAVRFYLLLSFRIPARLARAEAGLDAEARGPYAQSVEPHGFQ